MSKNSVFTYLHRIYRLCVFCFCVYVYVSVCVWVNMCACVRIHKWYFCTQRMSLYSDKGDIDTGMELQGINADKYFFHWTFSRVHTCGNHGGGFPQGVTKPGRLALNSEHFCCQDRADKDHHCKTQDPLQSVQTLQEVLMALTNTSWESETSWETGSQRKRKRGGNEREGECGRQIKRRRYRKTERDTNRPVETDR